uniref:Uncharacterized protein n=1 Tax=Ailuropoda melanoleuca TaxID=9646 RepID=A0A7N5KBN3_AILME
MKRKCLVFAVLLIAGTTSLLAHDGDDHDHDDDDDVIDIEDDLDNGVEEVEELKHEASAPPLPKVTYTAPVPTGEVYFAENFDKGTLEGILNFLGIKDLC